MTNLHPHWQTTDEDELTVPVRIASASNEEQLSPKISVPAASRMPGAVIGVLLFLGIGFAMFQGVYSFMGQVTSDRIEIVITETGVEPPVATARPGQTIVWKNESTIPHILASETLPTDDGKPFETAAIFQDMEEEYVVPLGAQNETHDYFSRTSAAITGQIIIDSAAAQEPSSEASSQTSSEEPIALPIQSSSVASSSAVPEYTPSSEAYTGGVPRNPYTVGTTPQYGTTSSQATTQVRQHRPTSQPQTGMAEWTILIMGLIALAVVRHMALQK